MSTDTREKIKDAAKKLFSEHGYAAVTTKKIAEGAGVSEVTLYRHFESKRSLFNAIVKENMLNFGLAEYLRIRATYDVRDDLTNIASLMINAYKQNKALIRMMMKDPFLKSEARSHSKRIESQDMKALSIYFEAIKEKKLVRDDPEKLMKFFNSNIHGFVMHNYIFKHESEDVGEKELEYFDWLISKMIDAILM